MTTYQRVEATALKIASVKTEEDGSGIITLIAEFPPFPVSAEYMAQYQPVAGGYYVVGEDGYKSYLPVEAIEK